MAEEEDILCVIPARGNSKGVPQKNLRSLAGKPLLAWTIEAARQSRYIDKVIVSTEDDAVAKVAMEYGAEVPFLRPSELAGDDIHAIAPVLYTVKKVAQDSSIKPSTVVMLLPTSPLRRVADIDSAIELFFEDRSYNIVSVCEFDKQMLHLRRIQDGEIHPIQKAENLNVQRQDLEKLYYLNGSIYVADADRLLREKTFHSAKVRPYIMEERYSVDINSLQDFKKAEMYLSF